MKRFLSLFALGAAVFAASGCEVNGITSKSVASDILDHANRICGEDREGVRGVENIMLLQDKEDDGIVTCHDGTNHYFDG